MKSKILKILGVVATVAILTSTLIAPVAAVSGVTATVAPADNVISTPNADYTIFANVASQLWGASSRLITLPDPGDAVTVTSAAAGDRVVVTGFTGATVTDAAAVYAAGTIVFTAAAQTVTFTAVNVNTTGTLKVMVGAPTIATTNVTVAPTITAGPGAFTLPDGGDDTVVITAAAATDVATLTFTTGAATVVFAPAATTGGYAAGVITFDAVGQTATITGTVDGTAGTWAQTTGLPTAAAGADAADAPVIGAAAASGDTITIGFPAGYVIAAPTAAVISASLGWVTPPGALVASNIASVTTGVTWTFDAAARTITGTLGLGDYIGETAQVRMVFPNGITNPTVAGDYTITVRTSKETTAVASNAVTIVNPTPAALPGVVKVYNASGILIYNEVSPTAIATSITKVLGTGWTIEITPGTYTEGTLTIPVALTGLTVKGTGTMAEILVGGNWVVNAGNVTFTNLTLSPGTASTVAVSVGATGGGIKIDACSLVRSGPTTSVTSQTLVSYGATTIGATTTAATGTISNNNINTQRGIARDVGVLVGTGSVGMTISNNTFATDYSETPNPIPWWDDAAIQANATCAITGNTFTGPGWGVQAEAGNVTITGNTFNGNHQALQVGAAWIGAGSANVLFDNNTLTGVGATPTAWPDPVTPAMSGTDAIVVTFNIGSNVTITNNKISGSGTYVLHADTTANVAGIRMMFNDIATTNAKGVRNLAAGTLTATHNWWGAATGPAAGYNTATAPAVVNAGNFLTAVIDPGAKVFVAPTATVSDATIGVAVTNVTAGAIAIARYPANPVMVNVPATVTAVRFIDVSVTGALAAVNTTIRINGTAAAPITAASGAYIWNKDFGRWDPVAGIISNPFANYIEFTVATNLLSGTPFALVDVKPTVPAAVPAQALPFTPLQGDIDFPVDGTLSWAPVAGATGYEIAIAEDSTLADKFAVIDYSASTPVNAHKVAADPALKYDTVYWWRVRAVNAVGPGAWTVGFFTTEKEPVEPTVPTTTAPPVVTITTAPPPQITLEIPAQPAPAPAIPTYLLWAVIAVGAILVIAVIVLIVRTRRIS